MPTNNIPTLVKAANAAIKALADKQASIRRQSFNETVVAYVSVAETFTSLEASLKAAHTGDSKWTQSAFIKAAEASGVKMPSQSTVSRIMAMSAHSSKRADAWRKLQKPEDVEFSRYAVYLGKLARNEITESGEVTEAGAEQQVKSEAAQEKRRNARAAVKLSTFDFETLVPAKATKKAKLQLLLEAKADLDAQIAVLAAELGEDVLTATREAVRKAEQAKVKAAKV